MAGEGATNGAVGSWQRSREQHTTLGKEGRNMQRARRSTLGKEGHTRQGGAQYIESTLHWAKSSTICREYYWAKRGTLGKEEHTVQRAKLGKESHASRQPFSLYRLLLLSSRAML